MPGYHYLDNGPRMDAIQSIGQTTGGLATALPQLQLQAQAYRQRLALQRAQELLNQQRGQESQARQKLYEGEMKLNESRGEEVKARTEHTKGQEGRERDIATAAMMMGQAMSQRYHAQQMGGAQGPPTEEQDAMQNAIQAAGLLSAKNPNMMGQFVNSVQGQSHNVPPGNVMVSAQGQPMYTNTQPTAAAMSPRVVSPGGVVYQGGEPTYTNLNSKAQSGAFDATTQKSLDEMKAGQQGGGIMDWIERKLGMGGGGQSPSPASVSPAKAPAPGTLYKGYRFKGGDPAQQQNWEKADDVQTFNDRQAVP